MQPRIFLTTIVTLTLFFLLTDKVGAQNERITMQQVDLLMQEKNSRTPAQRKIDSKLLQATREKRGLKMAEGVSLDPANVNADSQGNLEVDISADVTDALIAKIKSLGGKIIYPSQEYHSIRAEINLSVVEKIAAFNEIKFIAPAALAITTGSGLKSKKITDKIKLPDFISASQNLKSSLTLEERAKRIRIQLQNYLKNLGSSSPVDLKEKFFTGTVNSQGDRTHRADDVRSIYGYAGQGIKIGVLSDSYNALGGAPADVASGNLPGTGNPVGNTTPVTVIADYFGTIASDEGRAMLQIVHDLAPKAQLFFATADLGEASYASNIKLLRNTYNCDVIIDDIFYYDEPVYEDGIVAQAVNTVTAAGAFYFSSAGNEGSLAKGVGGLWEGDFNDNGTDTTWGSKVGRMHNFGTVSDPIYGDTLLTVGNRYTLNWADPIGLSNNDYDLFLVSSSGVIKGSSTNIQTGTQNPYEEITPLTLASGDKFVIFKTTSAEARAFSLNTYRGTLIKATNGQIHGHSAATNGFSVAATPAVYPGPYPNAFAAGNQVETFSSDGPRRVFYNADTTAITPGNFLFATNGGSVRLKPDITAADGVSTNLGPNSKLSTFYGTSAAAPHAGAIAALLKSANPALTLSQLRTILTSTALDIETPGYDNLSGAGIVQAFQAMQALLPAPMASLSLGTVTPTEGSYSNGNGIIEPGESANITVQLSNQSIVGVTNVNAVLTTLTPGVTIVQNTFNYGNIGAGSSVTNTGTPYTIVINSNTVPCGTIINFVLNVSYTGGNLSPQGFQFPVNVAASYTNINISATLDNTPSSGGTGYTATTGQQTGRISRSGVASTCAGKANPGLTTTTGSRQYDAYTFSNTNGANGCVTVTFASSNGVNLYTAAYNNPGFVPADPSNNFLGDPGGSSNSAISFSFTAQAGQPFTIVVHDVAAGAASSSPYTLSLTIPNCSAGPACTLINITTPSLSNGTTGTAYSQSFTSTGGSGYYLYTLTGALPTGLAFSGNTISGTPTQTGSFPLTLTVNDAAGCPSGTKNFVLIISPIPTWVGGTSNDWNTASNWSVNRVPTASDPDILIPSGASNMPVLITGTQTSTNLNIQTGASINVTGTLLVAGTLINNGTISGSGTTMLNGVSLQSIYGIGTVSNLTSTNSSTVTVVSTNNMVNVTGILKLTTGTFATNGNLTLKSTASGTASIGQISGGTITGNVTVERYFSNKRAWRLTGIPFSSSAQTIKASWMEGAPSASSDPNPGYGTQITTFSADSRAANFDATKFASSIRLFSADNFNSDSLHTPNTSNLITTDPAYFLFVRGDRSVDRTIAGSASSATTLRSTGLVRQGNISAGVTGTNFSLIPNIYPSAIDFDSIKTIGTNAGINTFYVWDPSISTVGQYRTITITGTTAPYTYTSTPGSQNNNWRFIESGTAFMIPGSATVDFTEATKTASLPPLSMLRITNVSSKQMELAVNLNIVNADNTVSLADGVREIFDNSYSAAIDNNDAKKIEGFEFNLGISSNNDVLSIEKRPLPNAGDTISLKLWNAAQGNYQFELQPANFSAISSAYLYDKYLNIYSAVDLKNNSTINFSITSDAASNSANRFSIVFTKAQLNTPSIVIYPNPVQNGYVKLQMNNMPAGTYSIKFVNSLGQTVLAKQINHAEGTSTETINTNKLNGIYLMEVVKPDNTKTVNKLIINN